jgi:hypothetical protein
MKPDKLFVMPQYFVQVELRDKTVLKSPIYCDANPAIEWLKELSQQLKMPYQRK